MVLVFYVHKIISSACTSRRKNVWILLPNNGPNYDLGMNERNDAVLYLKRLREHIECKIFFENTTLKRHSKKWSPTLVTM